MARVIADLGCHAVGLQEVDSRGGNESIRELEQRTGARAVAGPTIVESGGDYGNALLITVPVLGVEQHDLTVPGRERRGAIEARLETDSGAAVTVIVTHLGLRSRERLRQVERLLEICNRRRTREPLVVVGDFNEWNPVGRPLRRLRSGLGRTGAIRTFPAWRPMLALDRIWVRPEGIGRAVRAVATEPTRVASDHLPLVTELDLPSTRARADR